MTDVPEIAPQPVKWGSLPIEDAGASAPGVPLPTAVYLVPLCPTCEGRLYPMPQPDAERLSHVCVNGHKWRND